ncbi:hypothetical protein, partial [Pyrobaculum sp.]|uniref:hypothetical protein n=1 Tax=Pyrobaculum sp. TaxID=2004705 RepID=UPI003D0D77D9
MHPLYTIDHKLREILEELRKRPSQQLLTGGAVAIGADYVGLARDSTLQLISQQLKPPIAITGGVAILSDRAGLAKESTLQAVLQRLRDTLQVTGAVSIASDAVGLARDSTLQSVLTQLRSTLAVTGSVSILGQPLSVSPSGVFPVSGVVGIVADSVGLARDSTLQSVLTQLRSTLAVTGAVGILGQPVSVSPATTFPVSGTVGIIADSVGLARDSTLQSILTQLRSWVAVTGSVSILGQPVSVLPASTFPVSGIVGIIADSVGLARDSTLQSILTQLRSVLAVTGTVGILGQPISVSPATTFPVSGTVGIVSDSVGLARDSTLQSILSQLRSVLAVTGAVEIAGQPISVTPASTFPVSGTVGIIADNVGLARDSTLQSILSQLRSTLAITGSVSILGQPVSVAPSATFPVSGTVGIIADSVGLARDSTLQSVLSQLRSWVSVTGSVSILGQPISVRPSTTFPVSGVVGIVADSVGLARDSTLQSVLSQLKSW